MKYDLVVISSETLDSHPSVGIYFPNSLYIFNIPDLTQRVYFETKIKFSKIAHFFLTSLNSKSIGGFHGLSITTFEAKKCAVNFSAPKGFEDVLKTYSELHTLTQMRPKVIRNYSDDNISVINHELKDSVAYQVKLCDVRGKFLPDKALKLGVKKGPSFKDLANGKSVQLENGNVVMPEMVTEPPYIGETVFFVDCCSMDDVNMLPDVKKFDFIVHFTKNEILMTKEYLSKFDPNQKAICFAESGRYTYNSVAALYAASAKISNNLLKPLVAFKTNIEIPKGFIDGIPKLEYAFAPPDKKRFVYPEINDFEEHFEEELPKFKDFMVTFLGTGSTFPSQYRNVSGILIHTHSGFIVLDVGEGFTGQLTRKYGINNLKYILSNINFIWISHLHGDHHFGLYQLLQKRAEICDSYVPLICNKNIELHINELQKKVGSLKYTYYSQDKIFKIGNNSIQSIPVDHCFDSHGCVCDIDGGWRIAYSGDRTITDHFTETVGSCDLLIHEATFTDDLLETALAKRHSTLSQAIQTGKDAHATFTVLTHFSQRYPKIPVFANELSNVAFAFDYMSFAFEDIDKLCKVCPKIFQMIQELEEKEDE